MANGAVTLAIGGCALLVLIIAFTTLPFQVDLRVALDETDAALSPTPNPAVGALIVATPEPTFAPTPTPTATPTPTPTTSPTPSPTPSPSAAPTPAPSRGIS